MHLGLHASAMEAPPTYGSGVLFRIWSIAVSSTSSVCVVAGGQSRVLMTYAQSTPSPRDLANEDAPGVLPGAGGVGRPGAVAPHRMQVNELRERVGRCAGSIVRRADLIDFPIAAIDAGDLQSGSQIQRIAAEPLILHDCLLGRTLRGQCGDDFHFGNSRGVKQRLLDVIEIAHPAYLLHHRAGQQITVVRILALRTRRKIERASVHIASDIQLRHG